MTSPLPEGPSQTRQEAADATVTDSPSPTVWALVGDKTGDNAQVLALARALNLPFTQKRLRYNRRRMLPNWLLGASLSSTTPEARAMITPPWPDLIIGIGQRSVPVARWIKQASGGKTRLVQLGRPRAPLGWFDLVVTTPQYGLPSRANVLHLDLPFQQRKPGLDSTDPDAAPDLGGAIVGVLVGGEIGPYRFDRRTVDTLADQLIRLCEARDARLMITTGRRLPREARERLRSATAERAAIFHAVGEPGPNPYDDILAQADELVVTTDSVSMIADAMQTGHPVHLFSPSLSPPPTWRLLNGAASMVGAVCPRGLRDVLVARGLVIPPRQTELVAQTMIQNGWATWLIDAPGATSAADSCERRSHEHILQRVRDLITHSP